MILARIFTELPDWISIPGLIFGVFGGYCLLGWIYGNQGKWK